MFDMSGVSCVVRKIDSVEAEQLLSTGKNPRPTLQRKVISYSSIMRRGDWGLSESAIIISDDGSLMNGFHRMQALIASQTTQLFIVVTGAPQAMLRYIDGGKSRTAVDIMRLVGNCDGMAQWKALLLTSITRLFASMPNVNSTPTTQADFPRLYLIVKKHVDFAMQACTSRKRGFAVAPVLCAIARAHAFCEQSEEQLRRLESFCEMIFRAELTCVPADVTSFAAKLDTFQTDGKYGGEAQKEVYNIASWVLAHICCGEQLPRDKKGLVMWTRAEKVTDWIPLTANMRLKLLSQEFNSVSRSGEKNKELRESYIPGLAGN